MKKLNIGTYAFGTDSPLSLGEKLQKAAEMGYTGIEFLASDLQENSLEDLKSMLKKTGLECVSLHASMNLISELMPKFAGLGGKMIVCPSHPFADKEEAIACAKLLEEKGRAAEQYGIRIGYHNHTAEFYEVDGQPLLEYMIENSDPQYVFFQLDCGWASAAGINCPALISKYAGRFFSVHVKENNKVIGVDKPRSAKDPAPRFPAIEKDENGQPILTEELKARFAAMQERFRPQCPMGDPASNLDWAAIKKAVDAQEGVDCVWTVEREFDYAGDRLKCLEDDCKWLKTHLPD